MARAEFSTKVRLAAAQRAGFPDNYRCECGCGQPITKSDSAEFHHLEEAESGDTPERRAYLRSIENCQVVRRSCHRRITKTETMPKIVKSRRQRQKEAGAWKPRQLVPGSKGTRWKKKMDGTVERRD